MNIRETIKALKEPMPYQWRVQSKTKTGKVMCSAYIDARDVMNRLDEVCAWEVSYREHADFVSATIRIHTDDGSYELRDWGNRLENDPQDQMYGQAMKSAASDAFKRAAVAWGVGRFIYEIDMVFLPCDQYGSPLDGQGNKIFDLTKHINNMKSGQQRQSAPAPEPQTAAPVEKPAPSSDLPELDAEKYDLMVKYITDGKIKQVEAGMKKYKLNDAQKKVLTSMISQQKAESIKNSAK